MPAKLTTPTHIGPNVLRLRARLGLQTEPVFVPVADTVGHSFDNCFFNVRDQVSVRGGMVLFGWMVWEEPGRIIEAVFHAVWVTPVGAMVDITPKRDREKRIVFIPDPAAVYEEKPVDSVRIPLRNDPDVLADIRMHEGMTKLRSKHNVEGKAEVPRGEVDQLLREVYGDKLDSRLSKLKPAQPGRNDPCPCGSGEKYKRCCG